MKTIKSKYLLFSIFLSLISCTAQADQIEASVVIPSHTTDYVPIFLSVNYRFDFNEDGQNNEVIKTIRKIQIENLIGYINNRISAYVLERTGDFEGCDFGNRFF